MATQTFNWAQWPDPNGNPCSVTVTYDDATLLASAVNLTKAASYRPTLSVLDEYAWVSSDPR